LARSRHFVFTKWWIRAAILNKNKEGGASMGGFIKKGLFLLTVIFAVVTVLELEQSLAQQTFTFEGSVAGITTHAFVRGNVTVKGAKGEIMNFAVGRKTVYVPSRYPGIGEWVKITYSLVRGQNVAYQVEILPAPAPSSPKKK
jgi:hypothetical protein